MRHILSLTYASSGHNFESVVNYAGENFRISHFGADFDRDIFKQIILNFDGKVDAIALTGLLPDMRVGSKLIEHLDSKKLRIIAKKSPVVEGFKFANIYIPWLIREFCKNNQKLIANESFAFHSGLLHESIAKALNEYTNKLIFADPYLHMRFPKLLHGLDALTKYSKRIGPLMAYAKLDHSKIGDYKKVSKTIMSKFFDSEVFVSSPTLLQRLDTKHLRDKILCLPYVWPAYEKYLYEEVGVRKIYSFQPEIECVKQEPRLSFPMLEALLLLTTQKSDQAGLDKDDVLQSLMKEGCHFEDKIKSMSKLHRRRRFSFVIHPLSVDHIFCHPKLKMLRPVASRFSKALEKGLDYMPVMKYGNIRGIKSDFDGQECTGEIYTLFSTPKIMKQARPEGVYKKLVSAAKMAADKGSKIIGLGAYTKIVGDAGVTVNELSPIPVTTGNSLSASATLWAARVACEKMGFISPYKKGKRIKGRAMVIGATGSIGAVSAKLLAGVFTDLVLVAPRPDKLLELKNEIEKTSKCENVEVAVSANKYVHDCDLIVVSTSSIGVKLLDMALIKPGCVVCDVSRPIAISKEEAISRPDVLVIESGEVELPGKIHIDCDIGLHDSVVYACLAETALLALEGRFESFTLSRSVDFERVKEIYDIARKHGARLAHIRGHSGKITDSEIALCREHALIARSQWKKTISQKAPDRVIENRVNLVSRDL